jgi:ATP-dependent exoDNAse (exonuclease V) alpha subunit
LNDEIYFDIDHIQEKLHVTYNEQQKVMITEAMRSEFMLVQGPPGTGKTSSIAGIVMSWLKAYKDDKIFICAPSNKAIQVCCDYLY